MDRNQYYSKINEGGFSIKVREALRSDPVFINYADTIDVIDCNGVIIVYGVVNNESIKEQVIVKIRSLGRSSEIQNKIIVR